MDRLTLRRRIREKMDDWPMTDTLAVAINATEEVLQVTNLNRYVLGGYIKIGSEIMQVQIASENTATISVLRGAKESTAAIHVINSPITIYSRFTDEEINEHITDCFNMIFPTIYVTVKDVTITTSSELTYDLSGLTIPIDPLYGIYQVELKDSDQAAWREHNKWYYNSDTLHFESPIESGKTLRISYISKYAAPTDDTSTTWTLPTEYTEMVEKYVSGRLQESNLNKRIQYYQYSAAGNPDAASVGDVMGVAGYSLYQFQQLLDRFSMPLPSFKPNRRLQYPSVIIDKQRRPVNEDLPS